MISIWYFVILIIFFWPSLFEKSMFVESQLPAGHEHNLAKEAAQSGCCARPQVGIGGTGAISGAWTISGEKCVATGKTIVDSSFKTLGMCHLKVFHKLRDLIWRLPRTKSLLKLVPAQHDLIWMMFWSIFFWFTLFFITCICRILFSHQLFSFDLTHWAELCFQGQWWVGGMTSDRFCWLKGLFETSHFEKRSQKRSEDQMYDLRKNKHPLLSRHENRFQMDNLSPFPLVFSNQFFDPLLPSRWSCGASRAFRSKTGRTRFALVAPRRNDGAKNRNLRAHLGGWKSKILRSRC